MITAKEARERVIDNYKKEMIVAEGYIALSILRKQVFCKLVNKVSSLTKEYLESKGYAVTLSSAGTIIHW